jgi:DNA polymerase-3 subunit delta
MAQAAAPRDIRAELARGQIEAIYCLYGKERFLRDRAVLALRGLCDPRTRDFNLDLLDAKTAGAEGILAAARTLPMMAARRVVIVRGVDELKAADTELLLPYVDAPARETVLVLLAEKVDARIKFFAALKKRGALVGFEAVRDRELPRFIVGEVRARGAAIAEPAARLLADVVGADLAQLAQAIDKLLLYVGPAERPTIREDDVAACVADTRARSIFDLMGAVGEGERDAAMRIARRMLADRESPIGMVAMLTRQFRHLALARELTEARAGKAEIASALGLNPYFIDGIVRQARRYTARGLRRAFELLYDADTMLKSSKVEDEIVVERLIVELARAG